MGFCSACVSYRVGCISRVQAFGDTEGVANKGRQIIMMAPQSAELLQSMRQRLEGRPVCGVNSDVSETQDQGRWQAELALRFSNSSALPSSGATSRAHGFTKLSRCQHKGPLYVQKPFYPEGDELAHVYLLHPPGGIVTGDHLSIDITAEVGAKALLTTPGAARMYRAREDEIQAKTSHDKLQRQTVQLTLEDQSTLEWFPLETIVYNGADVHLNTTVRLNKSASYMAWEITCFGLPASDQLFDHGSFQQDYQVWRDDKPIFIDRLTLDDHNRRRFLLSSAAMDAHPVYGFFIACGLSKNDALLERIRGLIERACLDRFVAVTQLGESLITRYLGGSAEQARKAFTLVWQEVRPLLLQREACAPRIWLT